MALYEGNQGAERDTESAQIWLSRAVKQVRSDATCCHRLHIVGLHTTLDCGLLIRATFGCWPDLLRTAADLQW